MGVSYVHARLRKIDGRGPGRDVKFFVDSGLIYSVLPEKIWWALRLKSEREFEFTLADGTPIKSGFQNVDSKFTANLPRHRLCSARKMFGHCSAP